MKTQRDKKRHYALKLKGPLCRWPWIAVIAAVLSVQFLLLGMTKPKVYAELRAKKFSLVDSNDRLRAFMQVSDEGSAAFAMLDQNQKLRLTFISYADGTTLINLLDDNEVVRLTCNVRADGTPNMAFAGRDGKPRAGISVRENDLPLINFFDGDGNLIWEAK